MTKQLREWTAPEDYHTVRYNPASNELELKALDGWRVWHPNARFVLDHADALNALRADPYVAPKGLREQIDEVLRSNIVISQAAENIAALIDRERPALGEVDGEVLRAELIRRGWTAEVDADVYPSRAQNGKRVRFVLIAPERAG